jgi:hypothetical protein
VQGYWRKRSIAKIRAKKVKPAIPAIPACLLMKAPQ